MTWDSRLASEKGESFVRLSPKLMGSMLTLGSIRII